MLNQPPKRGRRTSNPSCLATWWVNQIPQPSKKRGASSEIGVMEQKRPSVRGYSYLSGIQYHDTVVIYNGIQTMAVGVRVNVSLQNS